MFEHFTFDHRLDGLVVGCRRDTKQLFVIEVLNNEVTSASSAVRHRALRGRRTGVPETWREPLRYEKEIDRWASESRRRRRVEPDLPTAGVVDLAARRTAQ
jgi:hypothetical protein